MRDDKSMRRNGVSHHSQRGVFADRFAFIQKPFTPDTLAAKVRSVLDARHS